MFAGNSNPALVKEICDCLGIGQGDALVSMFSDGEIQVQINENVRGKDVFLCQSCCDPVNKHLMELLLMLDALKRSSAYRITAVIPYYGYGRQDRKDQPRVPISAKLVADLITTAGADRGLTMDLHAGQIQGFFNIPVDHLRAMPLFADYLREKILPAPVVVAADDGAVKRSKQLADRLDLPLAIVFQRRVGRDAKETVQVVGEVEGRTPVMIEDIISTARTIAGAVDVVIRQGARPQVYVFATHAVLAGPARERLARDEIQEVVVTNTIPPPPGPPIPKLTVLSAAPLLAEAIRRIHLDQSVSMLFT